MSWKKIINNIKEIRMGNELEENANNIKVFWQKSVIDYELLISGGKQCIRKILIL